MLAPRPLLRAATAIMMALPCLSPVGVAQEHTLRTLSGIVTDQSHEPVRGAIVELKNPANNSIESYLTQADGHYIFKRLDGENDYVVWVIFRNRHSPNHAISKFDSRQNKVINFEIKSY